MIVYIDFDGVLYDTVSIILNEMKKNNISFEKDCSKFFEKLDWKKILYSAQEINLSISKIEKLKSKYNIKILTHVSSLNEMEEKSNFIRNKFTDIDIIFVPKKLDKNFIVNAKNNILIDDSKKNIDNWNKNGGIGILFGQNGISDLFDLENNSRGDNND